MFVAIQLIIQMCTSLLRCWLNLALQVSQGSASTCFRWSGYVWHIFVEVHSRILQFLLKSVHIRQRWSKR